MRRLLALTAILAAVMLAGVSAVAAQQLAPPTKITTPEFNVGYRVGWSVDVSADYAVIGAYGENRGGAQNIGAAYVYQWNGTNWDNPQKLTAPDGVAQDEFGWAVAVSTPGTLANPWVAVGAWIDDDEGNAPGKVYLYERVNNTWTYRQTLDAGTDAANLDHFGYALDFAPAGDALLVGVPGSDINAQDSGAAYLFEWNTGTSDWGQTQRLLPDSPTQLEGFGYSVALSADTALIGAPFDALGRGTVYTFETGTTNPLDFDQAITGSDSIGASFSRPVGDFFGASVALEGNLAAVGAWQADKINGNLSEGAVYLFENQAGGWAQQQKLTADGPDEDGFGFSVALAGNRLFTGADVDDISENPLTGMPIADGSGDESGTLYGFTTDGGPWAQSTKYAPGSIQAADFYGAAVALHGDRLLVSAWGDDARADESGAVYAFDLARNPQGADVTGDGVVTPADAVYVINRLNTTDALADLDASGTVTVDDIGQVIDALGTTLP